jgi:K+-sensing histidine kinase KdpD
MSAARQIPKNDGVREVPWNDVVRFVRQLSHDLRNHLNALELQSTYLGELAQEPELKSEIKKLREMVSELGGNLQKLTTSLGEPNPKVMSYRAADVVQDLQHKIETEMPNESTSIDWKIELQNETLTIDPQLLQHALLELFRNAYQHDRGEGNLLVSAKSDAGHFTLTLCEPKKQFDESTENWGKQPFHKTGRGHYGLGLHRARVMIENQQGQLQAHYNAATSILITTLTLPLARGGG